MDPRERRDRVDRGSVVVVDSQLKPIKDLTEEQGSQLAGLDIIIKNAKASDVQTDTEIPGSVGA
jgi:hypothetical protein